MGVNRVGSMEAEHGLPPSVLQGTSHRSERQGLEMPLLGLDLVPRSRDRGGLDAGCCVVKTIDKTAWDPVGRGEEEK